MKALVIEGGGMKAAYANGVLTAFEQAGYHPWDMVLGTSAGGALAAWMSAKQAEYAEETWKYAADPRILNIRRAVTRQGPLLDHDALLEIIYLDEHPLDQNAVKSAPWPVVVTAVDADDATIAYTDIRKGDIIAWLKATARLPLGSGDPVSINGKRWFDGGILDPIPVRYAVESLGATNLTLVTNEFNPIPKKDSKLLIQRVSKNYPNLRKPMESHQEIKLEARTYAQKPPEGIESTIISPSNKIRLHRLSRNLERINEGLEIGRHDGEAHLRNLDRS